MHQPSPRPPIRWWPLPVTAAAYGLALAFLWRGDTLNRQALWTATLLLGMLWLLAVVVWLLFFARLRRKGRLIVLAVAVGLSATAAATLEIRGVSGDVLPILGWRWSPRADAGLATEAAPGAADAAAVHATDHDYPRFLGPHGDGVLPDTRLAEDWTAHPPEELWRIEVGLGWSAFAVMGDVAVTMEQRGDQEMVTCYDLHTGTLRWLHGVAARHVDTLGGDGPRATPTLYDGRVYSLGAGGLLQCLDLLTGNPVWSVDILEDNGAAAPPFGVSASPLVQGDHVIVPAGGPDGRSLVIYDRHSGARLAAGGNDAAGYATPVPARLVDINQLLVFNNDALAGHRADDAALLWRFPWPQGSEHVCRPIPLPGNRVFLSSGYGVGARLLQLKPGMAGPEVRELWAARTLKAKFCNVFYHQGAFYGLDDGIMACIDEKDGRRRWKSGRYGHGQMMQVGNHFLVISERGTLALVRIDPDKHDERASLQVLQGKTWNHPALAGDLLLLRNDREAVCLRLALEP